MARLQRRSDGDHYSPLRRSIAPTCSSCKLRGVSTPARKGQIQTNPLIVGRTLYAYTPSQKVIALDAATGKLKWKFDSGIKGTQPARGFATGPTVTRAASSPAS